MTISKKYIVILSSILVLLLIPFIAMQFSSEVNWSLFDFLIAGAGLLALGFSIDLVTRKIKPFNKKLIAVAVIVMLFLLVWTELAVGVFGTPFAGN